MSLVGFFSGQRAFQSCIWIRKIKCFPYFNFLLSSLRIRSFLHLTKEFYHYHLSLLCFRFAALRPDHIPLADFQIRWPKESIQEPPLNQTTLDYQIPPQIRQQQTMIRPDYQIRPSDQTSTATPDHQLTSLHQTTDHHPWLLSIQSAQHTQSLEMVQVRCILYGLGQGG